MQQSFAELFFKSFQNQSKKLSHLLQEASNVFMNVNVDFPLL